MKRIINGHEVLFDKKDSELVKGYNWKCYQNSCGQIYFTAYDKNSKRVLRLHRVKLKTNTTRRNTRMLGIQNSKV